VSHVDIECVYIHLAMWIASCAV